MENKVDFDKPISKYVFECCIDCGRFIRTKDKAKLTLFMFDHYGEKGIKRCYHRWYGEFVWTLLNWRYRNG